MTSVQNVNVENLQTPVNLEIPVTNARPHDTYECAYFNETQKAWTPIPGSFDKEAGAMQCQTTHLSAFTVLAFRSDERPYLLGLLGILDVVFIGSMIAALILDRKNPSKQ
jgi:hypothetical protein